MTFIEDCPQEGVSRANFLCLLVRYLNARDKTCLENSPKAHMEGRVLPMLFKGQLCISIFYDSILFFLLDCKSVVLI